ncbi:uncharacterized protein PG986_002760 [Apiospora aurea]|uniref:Uncharacterized protein n=1 Tax=Apiospora aurea TaxID=335848 RepID=A0ABR1QPR7_9PEZI
MSEFNLAAFIFLAPFVLAHLVACIIKYNTGTKPELVSGLVMTFMWAFVAQKIHADLRLCRAVVYHKCVAGWMDLRRRFWAAVHHPIDPHEDEDDPGNPGLQAICFLIKLFQIHVEFVALRRFNYWIGNAGLPALALKPKLTW